MLRCLNPRSYHSCALTINHSPFISDKESIVEDWQGSSKYSGALSMTRFLTSISDVFDELINVLDIKSFVQS
jgi:hypothetical protein